MKDPFDTGETARHLKIGVTGPSGSGKTCFGLDAKNFEMGPVAIISFEAGDVLLEKSPRWGSFKFLRTQSIEELEAAITFLEQNAGKYGLLVLDTITAIYELLVDAKAGDDGSVHKGAWGLIKRKGKSIMTRLVNLPMHIVFVVHEQDLAEEDKKTGKLQVVGQKLDADKNFIRSPDFMIRLTVSKDGGDRRGELQKVRGDPELHGFRIGQVLKDPDIGMLKKAIQVGGAEARVAPPEEVARGNAAAMEKPKNPDEQLAAELIAHFAEGFDHDIHKENSKKKYRDQINSLPLPLKKKVVAAFENATVRGSPPPPAQETPPAAGAAPAQAGGAA